MGMFLSSLRVVALAFSALVLTSASTACTSDAADGEEDESTVGELVSFDCAHEEVSKSRNVQANVAAVRASGHPGYDRWVMEFAKGDSVPGYHIGRQNSAKFFQDASGDPINLGGAAGIALTVRSASGYGTFHGPRRFAVGDAKIMTEAAQTGDFEGDVSWGLGLKRAACYRVFELSNPARLVVDVQNDGPPLDVTTNPALAPFQCNKSHIASGGSHAPFGQIVAVRSAGHPDYDRFVVEFADGQGRGVPAFDLTYQSSPKFYGTGEDETILRGTVGLGLVLQNATGYDDNTGKPSYSGPNPLDTVDGKVLLQSALTDDFEHVAAFGLGLANKSCFRAFKLADPPRLVVDVQR